MNPNQQKSCFAKIYPINPPFHMNSHSLIPYNYYYTIYVVSCVYMPCMVRVPNRYVIIIYILYKLLYNYNLYII